MAFGPSNNLPFTNACVNQPFLQDVHLSTDAQSSFSNDSNVNETFEINGLGEASIEDHVHSCLLSLEKQKHKILQYKLRELQKKKGYMDTIRNDQRFKSSRHQNNLQFQQTRYEADGSEDELTNYPLHKSSLNKSCLERRSTESPQGRWNELEEIDKILKEVEKLIKLLQDKESSFNILDNQTFQDFLNQYSSLNNESKFDHRVSLIDEHKNRSHEARSINDEVNTWSRYNNISANNHNDADVKPGSYSHDSLGSPLSEESIGNEISQSIHDYLMQSMQNNFDSMRMILENSNFNNYISNQQFFYLMLIQNCQMLQQQQMLLYLLYRSHNDPNCEVKSNEAVLSPLSWLNLPKLPSFLGAHMLTKTPVEASNISNSAPNNKLPQSTHANNYWDNFKTNFLQNQLNANVLSARGIVSKNSDGSKTSINNGVNNEINNDSGNRNNKDGNIQICHNSNFNNTVPKVMDMTGEIKKYGYPTHSKKPFPSHQYESTNEKIRNTTLNDNSNRSQQQPNELNPLFSKNCTVLSMDKNETSMPASRALGSKMKASNIMHCDEEASGSGLKKDFIESAIGEKERIFVSPNMEQSLSTTIINGIHRPFTLSNGAIREKLRNPDVIESAKKYDSKDKANGHLESVRPLMAAEGRSYESKIGSGGHSSKSYSRLQNYALLLFSKRPTNAISGDDNDDNANDDDLVEADQTAIKIPETSIYSSDSVSSPSNIMSSTMCDSSVELENTRHEAKQEGIREVERLEVIGIVTGNKNGVRLSGDGEQGL